MPASYGSIESPRRRKPKPVWEERGSELSIVLAVSAGTISHVFFVFAIFQCLAGTDSRLFSCRDKEKLLRRYGETTVCEYLSAYLECLPELSVVVVLILAARNLLDLRLYYVMLSRKAVVLFKSKNFMADWLICVYLWGYVHVMFHIMWISHFVLTYGAKSYLQGEEISRGPPADDWIKLLGYLAPRSDWDRVGELLILIVLPLTLFVVFLKGSYDIEKALVPLSEYFDNVRLRIYDTQEWQPDATCTLVAMTDTAMKACVDSGYEDLMKASSDLNELADNIIDKYRKNGVSYEEVRERHSLTSSLWPASLLTFGQAAQSGFFRALYIWYTCFATIVVFAMLYIMGMVSLRTSGVDGASVLHTMVVWAQLLIAGFVGYTLITSLCSCCHHPTASGRSC